MNNRAENILLATATASNAYSMIAKGSGKNNHKMVESLDMTIGALQTLLFSLIAATVKDESVAVIYGKMRAMTNLALDKVIEDPDILTQAPYYKKPECKESIDKVIALFNEMKQGG